MRHPQYTGLFIALFGEGVVHWPTVFSVAALPFIILVYGLLACREEARMVELFGEEYREYQRQVPMFLPGWRQWRQLVGWSRSRAASGESQI
jgi:protein-S-isoprenylcysteine O-methyltransferase Ste14